METSHPDSGQCPEPRSPDNPVHSTPPTGAEYPRKLFGGPNCDCLRNYERKPIGPIRIGFFQIDADGSKPPGAPSVIPIIRKHIAEHGNPHPPTNAQARVRNPEPPSSAGQ